MKLFVRTSSRRRLLSLSLSFAMLSVSACGDEGGGSNPDDDASDLLDDVNSDVDGGGDADGASDLSDSGDDSDSDEEFCDPSTIEPPIEEVAFPPVYTETREACADRNELRNLYWGDLHIHTARSFDAYVFETRNGPSEAYDYAKGQPLMLPPLDQDGEGTVVSQLDRPLDFAAVTDHSEFLGEVDSCRDPQSEVFDSNACEQMRSADALFIANVAASLTNTNSSRVQSICGEGNEDCVDRNQSVWEEMIDINEDHYDRTSACEFTSLIGYEWSGATRTNNLHRCVLFRNNDVPDQTISYFDQRVPEGLWDALDAQCTGNCDTLAIPHNSNLAAGTMFIVEAEDADGPNECRAAQRARLEPLIELIQHKGDAECVNGFQPAFGETDELCSFEKIHEMANIPLVSCDGDGGVGGITGAPSCISGRDFAREILVTGMIERLRVGVNPFPLGFVGSTDTHNATPGDVQEDKYIGHWGSQEDELDERLSSTNEQGIPGGRFYNAGGLTGVWAVENSRDALFAALRRRETYATSGPRLSVRFFGGTDLDADACSSPTLLEDAYEDGVPMGGTLESLEGAPSFIVQAARDTGGLETPIQRVQIIKGWVDDAGQGQVEVFDIAGDADNGASVDVNTCETSGPGLDDVCTVWTDPDFDPDENAYYYVRVVENPTCRWTTFTCNALPEDDRPAGCSDERVPKTIQERAWTSPIWYEP